MRRIGWLSRGALIAIAISLAGCSAFGDSRPAPAPLPATVGNAPIKRIAPIWSSAVGKASGVGFAPVSIGDAVWAATSDGTVVKLSIDTGQILWRTQLGRTLTAGVGTDGSTVVVVTREGTLIALDEQGRSRWTSALAGEVVTPPAVGDGLVLVRTTDNRVLVFDAETGKSRWNFSRQNPPLVLRHSGGVAMIPGVAFVGMPGGRMLALSLQNGAPRWDVPFAQPRGTTELERIADVVGSPLVFGREVCAVSYQGRIGCLDRASGAASWLKEFSSAVGLDVDARGVVAPDDKDGVYAFDRGGEPQWQNRSFARRRLSAPLIVGNAVALGDLEGNILWLGRTDGRLQALSRTDGRPIVAPPVSVGDVLVVQTSGGGVFAFKAP